MRLTRVGAVRRRRTRRALVRMVLASTGFILSGCDRPSVGSDPAMSEPRDQAEVHTRWVAGGKDDLGGVTLAAVPAGGAIAEDGVVALVDQLAPSVFLLDHQGAVRTLIGAAGDGPGEYRSPREVGFWGDSLVWVSDGASGRITVYDRDGHVVQTISRPWQPVPQSAWSVQGRWLLVDGSVLGAPTGPSVEWGGPYPPIPLAVWSPDATLHVRDWLPTPGPRVLQIRTPAGPSIGSTQPIDGSPLVGISRRGEWLFVLDRAPASSGDRIGRIGIRRWDLSGTLVDHLSIPYHPRVADEDLRAWHEREGEWRAEAINKTLSPDLGQITAKDVRNAIWVPETLPPVRAAFGDEEGYWLQRERAFPSAADGPNIWERYDLSGTLLLRFDLPHRFRGIASSPHALLGWSTDTLGIVEVHYFDVTYRGGGAR